MSNKRSIFTVLGASLLAIALVACSSSDNPTTPGGGGTADTTPPQIVGTTPVNGATGFAADGAVTIIFNEAMDPASSAGAVTLSEGSVTGATWSDSRTLVVAHGAWSEGAHVTVTVATDLADTSGNNLAAAYQFSFYVQTSTLQVLNVAPADGATGVNRDASVQVLFSLPLDAGTLAANTTIRDAGSTTYPFSVSDNGTAFTLDPNDRLPASTAITVTIGAAVAAYGGGTLGSDYAFTFTTGADVDVTPPTVVSSTPAVGATVDPDLGYFQVVFSEPMDPMSFEPSAWNLELMMAIADSPSDPTWSADLTTVTVPLPSPLPDGLPMAITFANLTDANGVVQTTPWAWHATVAGTPDYYPAVDGLQMVFQTVWADGTLGSTTPDNSGSGEEYVQIDDQGDGTFRLARYDGTFTTPTGEYDVYSRLNDRLQWVGFTNGNDVDGYVEVDFATPVQVLPLPPAVGTWTADTSATVPGEGTYTATLHGTVVQKTDVPLGTMGSQTVFAKDVYQVVRHMDITFGGNPAMARDDTTWYSPTLGPLEEGQFETSQMDSTWWSTHRWRNLFLR